MLLGCPATSQQLQNVYMQTWLKGHASRFSFVFCTYHGLTCQCEQDAGRWVDLHRAITCHQLHRIAANLLICDTDYTDDACTLHLHFNSNRLLRKPARGASKGVGWQVVKQGLDPQATIPSPYPGTCRHQQQRMPTQQQCLSRNSSAAVMAVWLLFPRFHLLPKDKRPQHRPLQVQANSSSSTMPGTIKRRTRLLHPTGSPLWAGQGSTHEWKKRWVPEGSVCRAQLSVLRRPLGMRSTQVQHTDAIAGAARRRSMQARIRARIKTQAQRADASTACRFRRSVL